MGRSALASVMTAPHSCEVRELPVPPVETDAAWLRVEAAGICGSDLRFYAAQAAERILGHENVGVISEIGPTASERWGVGEGDRVVVEEYLPCGHCDFCRGRDFRLCDECDPFMHQEAARFGTTPLSVAPGLWGGFAQYLYLPPRAVLHKVDRMAPWRHLSMSLPIGNGFEWAYFEGGTGPGQTIVILGPGQQGLGCVLAAREAGAGEIVVFGLPRDHERLEVARALGADEAFALSGDEAVEALATLTNGELADVVIDTAAGSTETVLTGIKMLRKKGKLLVPTARPEGIDKLPLGALTSKCLTLRGVRGHSFESVEMAIDLIASGRYPLERMATHAFGVEDVDLGIRYVAGEGPDSTVHVSICPWGEDKHAG